MAFFAASNGSEAGFAAFDQVSQRSAKYDASDTRRRWEHFHQSPPAPARPRHADLRGAPGRSGRSGSNRGKPLRPARGQRGVAKDPQQRTRALLVRTSRHANGALACSETRRGQRATASPTPCSSFVLMRASSAGCAWTSFIRRRSRATCLGTEAPLGGRGRTSTTSSSRTGASCAASSSNQRPVLRRSRWSRHTTGTTPCAGISRACAGTARLASTCGSRPISAPGSMRRRSMPASRTTT